MEKEKKERESFERPICLYHRDGRVFIYYVTVPSRDIVNSKVTEHIQRIAKIKSCNIETNYPDITKRT